jgi:hypothetical protein
MGCIAMSSTEADTIIAKSTIRHALRAIGQQFPWLRQYSGRLGLGRLVAPNSTCEQIIIDDDSIIELDLTRLDSHDAENALFISIARIEETVARLS